MITRREFIKLCLAGLASLTLSELLIPELAEALLYKGPSRPTVIWLECTTCAGDYFSFLNTLHPDLQQILFKTIDMQYSNTLMTAEGALAINHLEKIAEEKWGEYILIVEGTIPTKDNGHYALIGHRDNGDPITDLEAVRWLAGGAKYILAAGTCASFGGPYAATPNPIGSRAVYQVVKEPVINVPGCPVHPDWIVGTLSHVLLYGSPNLDAFHRPLLFYGKTIHNRCPRRADFENSNFANHPGESGCLYKIGCKGPVTYSDCPTRQWIGDHTNWPVEANTPCIGCVAPDFPDRMAPFFQHLPDITLPAVALNARTVGKAAIGAAAVGVSAHLALTTVSGRLKKHMLDGTETSEINPDIFTVEHKPRLEEIAELEEKIRCLKAGPKHFSLMERFKAFFHRFRLKKNDQEE